MTTCGPDSGEVLEPEPYREWSLKGPARAEPPHYDQVTAECRHACASIETALIGQGWSGPAKLTGKDIRSTALAKRYDRYTVTSTIAVHELSVLVDGSTPYHRIGRSGE